MFFLLNLPGSLLCYICCLSCTCWDGYYVFFSQQKVIILCFELVRWALGGGFNGSSLAKESNIHLIDTIHFYLFLYHSLSLLLSLSFSFSLFSHIHTHTLHRLHGSMASMVSVSQRLADLDIVS